ncbi:MAG: hypothetical protein ACRCZ2_02800 [Fusobacteriaceae bacterium]
MDFLDIIGKINLEKVNPMGMIIGLTAFLMGFKFPDWDFKFKLRHRNILTHSPLILAVMIFFYGRDPNEISRFFIMGFSLGMGIHFIYDLFPKGWGGSALIHIPVIKKSCGVKGSIALFKIFSLMSIVIAILFTLESYEIVTIFLLGIATLIKNISKEKKLIRPTLVYTLIFLVFSFIKYQTFK